MKKSANYLPFKNKTDAKLNVRIKDPHPPTLPSMNSYKHVLLKTTINTTRLKNQIAVTTKNCFSNSKIVTKTPSTVVELRETSIFFAIVEKVKQTLFKGALVKTERWRGKTTMGRTNELADIHIFLKIILIYIF